MKAALWIIGGLCIGSGFLMMLPNRTSSGGIGVANPDGTYAGEASQVYYATGYDTIADVAMFGQGWLAILLALTGMALLVFANATAWRETGGY